MTETTEKERAQILAVHGGGGRVGAAVRDADRLAQYESQCIPRTADMPADAVGWERYPAGVAMQGGFQCQWIRRKGRVDPAPDLIPDEPGPVFKHIVTLESE